MRETGIKWGWFAKKTVGAQFAEAVNSISANIAEGFGRHFKKDKVNSYRYRKGSLKESYDWTQNSKVRELIKAEQYDFIFRELENLPLSLNHFIKYTNEKLKI